MEIEVGKKYKTRHGFNAKIYSINNGGDYPVHGAIDTGDGWVPDSWTNCGKFRLRKESARDLVEPPVKWKTTASYGASMGAVNEFFCEHPGKEFDVTFEEIVKK